MTDTAADVFYSDLPLSARLRALARAFLDWGGFNTKIITTIEDAATALEAPPTPLPDGTHISGDYSHQHPALHRIPVPGGAIYRSVIRRDTGHVSMAQCFVPGVPDTRG